MFITESTLIPFAPNDSHKVYIFNLDIDFDGILGLDFLDHYKCVIDLKAKQLITNFKTIPLFKVVNKQEILNQTKPMHNVISIEPRTERIFKLKGNLSNTDAILLTQEKEKVRIPNALVHLDDKGEFFTTIINKNADALSRIKVNHFQQCANLQSKISILASNETEEQNNTDESEQDQKLTEEYNTFVHAYKTKSIIDYSKIETSNEQLLDKTHKNILTFFRQNKLEDIHHQIIDDIFEENIDFKESGINVLNSKTIKDRNYFIIFLSFDPETTVQTLFYSLYKDQLKLDISKTYYIENNLDLPILEIISYIFQNEEIKFKICQNIIRTPEQEEIPILLDQYHTGKNNIHRGINETIRRIKAKYNWAGLTKDVEEFIKRCEICQKTKICRRNLSTPLVITETPKTAFERINIDIFEYPIRNYALTIRDELTKFTQAYPMENKKASTVVNTLLVFFQHFGTPLRIHCDYGREFDNSLIKDLCELYDIKLTFSSVGHPQSNGSLERFHATLTEMIRAHTAENPDEHPFNILPYATICYNNTKNKTHGFTPYELIFGHTSGRPPETLYNKTNLITKYIRDLNNRMEYYYKIARKRTELQKEKSKIRFDKNVKDQIPEYKIGDQVYVKNVQIKDKSKNLFNGPFKITKLFDTSAILLNPETNQSTKVNFDRLKPYYE